MSEAKISINLAHFSVFQIEVLHHFFILICLMLLYFKYNIHLSRFETCTNTVTVEYSAQGFRGPFHVLKRQYYMSLCVSVAACGFLGFGIFRLIHGRKPNWDSHI